MVAGIDYIPAEAKALPREGGIGSLVHNGGSTAACTPPLYRSDITVFNCLSCVVKLSVLLALPRCWAEGGQHVGWRPVCSCCLAEIPVEALVDEDELESSVDSMVMESKDDDMEAVGSEPAKYQSAGVAISAAIQSASQMDAEASQKGYGKAYAAFKGGREGLEACAASKTHLVSSHLTSPHLTPHLTSPHLTSPHHTAPCPIVFHVGSTHLTSPAFHLI